MSRQAIRKWKLGIVLAGLAPFIGWLPAWADTQYQQSQQQELKSLVQQLKSKSSTENATSIASRNSTEAQLLYPRQNTSLQKLIDLLTHALIKTKQGLIICNQILGADAENILAHLGVTRRRAHLIANDCYATGKGQQPSEKSVQSSSKPPALKKAHTLAQFDKRSFYLMLVDDNKEAFDSWTEPFTHRTALISSREDLSVRHLAQLLAHEMAIYFDAKSAVGTAAWRGLPSTGHIKIPGQATSTALANPLIASSLAALRAYKVEKNMIRELEKKSIIPSKKNDYPLVDSLSNEDSLEASIKTLSEQLIPYSLSLVAYSPLYRRLKAQQLQTGATRRPPVPSSQRQQCLAQPEKASHINCQLHVLQELPLKIFFQKISIDAPLDKIFQVIQSTKYQKAQQLASKVFKDIFLKEDLQNLFQNPVISNGSKKTELLQFMTTPLLSGANTQLAQGPRPRIRTGQ